jgi:hypothetical protein
MPNWHSSQGGLPGGGELEAENQRMSMASQVRSEGTHGSIRGKSYRFQMGVRGQGPGQRSM